MITNVDLTTKEQLLLQDQKTHEEQCIIKYENYTNLATDVQLKAVFRSNGQKEEEHLQTITQLLSGKIPSMTGQGNQNNQTQGGQTSQTNQVSQGGVNWQQTGQSGSTNSRLSDKDMCIDMLSTEKYVSGTYDTAIFEFRNAQIRDVLNHIQKEEQKHGEAIFSYMHSKGMYSAQ